MKLIFVVLAVLGLTIGSATAAHDLTVAAADNALTTSVDQGQPPSGQIDVNIDVDRDGAVWYESPVWIAIGVVGLVLIIALIITATRGGNTTVVKE